MLLSYDAFEEIGRDGKHLIKRIKDLSKKQRHLWRRIPYLALQADGRLGWNDDYKLAYCSGYWNIGIGDSTGGIYVDLETGRLVNAFDPRQRPADYHVLQLATRLVCINAERIVRQLHAAACEPIASYSHAKEREKREQYIASILAQGNITSQEYRRIINPKEVYQANVVQPLLDLVGG